MDIVLDSTTPLWKAHDVGQDLQDKLEVLPNVERAFVHVDYETTHYPVRYFSSLPSALPSSPPLPSPPSHRPVNRYPATSLPYSSHCNPESDTDAVYRNTANNFHRHIRRSRYHDMSPSFSLSCSLSRAYSFFCILNFVVYMYSIPPYTCFLAFAFSYLVPLPAYVV